MDQNQNKLEILRNDLFSLKNLLIAFSGGVDSTFLLKVSLDVLGRENVLAVTACSSTYPAREKNEAISLAKLLDAQHELIISEELDIPEFRVNPVNRCYFCKKELFGKLKSLAAEKGYLHVADGSNLDDSFDFRPGRQAGTELGIISPLREAGLTKRDIRELSRKLDLPTWNKPALACLSSRFPYGVPISVTKLKAVEEAESFLKDLGFKQLRVRHHGDIARIELDRDDFTRIFQDGTSFKIIGRLKELGFTYVAVDLEGYRTGSMNEALNLPAPT